MDLPLRRALPASVVLGVLLSAGVAAASPKTFSFASDTSWTVFDGDPSDGVVVNVLGPAELVCLNAYAPVPCPAGAILYGHDGGGWGADLSLVPGASWIWGPGIMGDTFPADLNQFYFSKTFYLPGPPLGGTVLVAVDDLADVRVNGRFVGSNGSITDVFAASLAQVTLAVLDLTPFLVEGQNTITIRGQNGPPSFAGSAVPTPYSLNPAAVVFGGTLTYDAIVPVAIDIKPNSYPNSINLGSNGVVPVAILGSATFDVRTVDPSTVTLANARIALRGQGTTMTSFEDVNGDGLLDLVVQVQTEALQLTPDDTTAVLLGGTTDGQTIRGVETVRIVP